MQGGKLPLGGGLVVWVCKHLVKFQYKPCPCHLFCIGWVEDGVDFLCGPGACGSSLHVQQDKQDIAVLIWCRQENCSFQGGTTLHISQGAEYVDGKGTSLMNLGRDRG